MFYRRQIPARSISLFLMDVVIVFLAMLAGSLLRLGFEEQAGWRFFVDHIPTAAGCSLIFSLVFYAAGMYEPSVLSRARSIIMVGMTSVSVGLGIVILALYVLFPTRHFGLGVNILTGIFLFAGVLLTRYFYRLVVGTGFFLKPALIVGGREDLEETIELLQETKNQPRYRIMGIVLTGRAESSGKFIEGFPVLGGFHDLSDFVEAYHVETVLVASSTVREAEILKGIRPLRYRGIECLDFIGLHEQLAQSIPLDHIDDEWLLHAAMNSSRIHIRKIKRVLDAATAALGLVVTLPLSLMAMTLIRLDSPGPIFYRQRRLGLGGAPITVLKFRTMREDAERDSGAVWAEKFDCRVTRVGRFLRASRIDEIPQLFNVLRGQMSLVGPRPERPEFVENLKKNIPFYEERLMMPPGITGWAQVRFPYAASIHASRYKLQYDLYYIKHTSLVFDVAILLRTFKTILIGLRHSEDQGPKSEEPPTLKLMNSELKESAS